MRERRMVPEPEFQSYYGRQIIKTPTWKTPDVPLYLFLGGLSGGSAVLAEGAALTGNRRLEHLMRGVAAGGAGVGTVFLIHDLGRPERFLNMLRVFKVTSPLSVGTYILAPFASLASAAFASQLTGRLPLLGRLAGVGAAALGPPLAGYTAALFANTSVPIWHEGHRELPFVFVGSGSAAAGGLAMVLTSVQDSAPGFRLAVAGASLELTAMGVMERRLGMLAEPYHLGKSGRLMKAARALTATGLGVSVLGRRSRLLRALAGVSYLAGSALTRFGVFEAGLASARDPKYIVVPQRARMAARQADANAGGVAGQGALAGGAGEAADHASHEQQVPSPAATR
ncbi:MAG TPA: NrfD/PsrC family molybdoenzyme membrane anchor subunit [Nocardioidaceae bacterium]|nr:NrfD/PsrC family molybdoenzyme membrane anchor subunit [Nocardioidaceae bacterium]